MQGNIPHSAACPDLPPPVFLVWVGGLPSKVYFNERWENFPFEQMYLSYSKRNLGCYSGSLLAQDVSEQRIRSLADIPPTCGWLLFHSYDQAQRCAEEIIATPLQLPGFPAPWRPDPELVRVFQRAQADPQRLAAALAEQAQRDMRHARIASGQLDDLPPDGIACTGAWEGGGQPLPSSFYSPEPPPPPPAPLSNVERAAATRLQEQATHAHAQQTRQPPSAVRHAPPQDALVPSSSGADMQGRAESRLQLPPVFKLSGAPSEVEVAPLPPSLPPASQEGERGKGCGAPPPPPTSAGGVPGASPAQVYEGVGVEGHGTPGGFKLPRGLPPQTLPLLTPVLDGNLQSPSAKAAPAEHASLCPGVLAGTAGVGGGRGEGGGRGVPAGNAQRAQQAGQPLSPRQAGKVQPPPAATAATGHVSALKPLKVVRQMSSQTTLGSQAASLGPLSPLSSPSCHASGGSGWGRRSRSRSQAGLASPSSKRGGGLPSPTARKLAKGLSPRQRQPLLQQQPTSPRSDVAENDPKRKTARKHLAKALSEAAPASAQHAQRDQLPDEVAQQVEAAVFSDYGHSRAGYTAKVHSLTQNLKNNRQLSGRVLSAELPPARLVQLSHDEMAREDLRQERARAKDQGLRNAVLPIEVAVERFTSVAMQQGGGRREGSPGLGGGGEGGTAGCIVLEAPPPVHLGGLTELGAGPAAAAAAGWGGGTAVGGLASDPDLASPFQLFPSHPLQEFETGGQEPGEEEEEYHPSDVMGLEGIRSWSVEDAEVPGSDAEREKALARPVDGAPSQRQVEQVQQGEHRHAQRTQQHEMLQQPAQHTQQATLSRGKGGEAHAGEGSAGRAVGEGGGGEGERDGGGAPSLEGRSGKHFRKCASSCGESRSLGVERSRRHRSETPEVRGGHSTQQPQQSRRAPGDGVTRSGTVRSREGGFMRDRSCDRRFTRSPERAARGRVRGERSRPPSRDHRRGRSNRSRSPRRSRTPGGRGRREGEQEWERGRAPGFNEQGERSREGERGPAPQQVAGGGGGGQRGEQGKHPRHEGSGGAKRRRSCSREEGRPRHGEREGSRRRSPPRATRVEGSGRREGRGSASPGQGWSRRRERSQPSPSPRDRDRVERRRLRELELLPPRSERRSDGRGEGRSGRVLGAAGDLHSDGTVLGCSVGGAHAVGREQCTDVAQQRPPAPGGLHFADGSWLLPPAVADLPPGFRGGDPLELPSQIPYGRPADPSLPALGSLVEPERTQHAQNARLQDTYPAPPPPQMDVRKEAGNLLAYLHVRGPTPSSTLLWQPLGQGGGGGLTGRTTLDVLELIVEGLVPEGCGIQQVVWGGGGAPLLTFPDAPHFIRYILQQEFPRTMGDFPSGSDTRPQLSRAASDIGSHHSHPGPLPPPHALPGTRRTVLLSDGVEMAENSPIQPPAAASAAGGGVARGTAAAGEGRGVEGGAGDFSRPFMPGVYIQGRRIETYRGPDPTATDPPPQGSPRGRRGPGGGGDQPSLRAPTLVQQPAAKPDPAQQEQQQVAGGLIPRDLPCGILSPSATSPVEIPGLNSPPTIPSAPLPPSPSTAFDLQPLPSLAAPAPPRKAGHAPKVVRSASILPPSSHYLPQPALAGSAHSAAAAAPHSASLPSQASVPPPLPGSSQLLMHPAGSATSALPQGTVLRGEGLGNFPGPATQPFPPAGQPAVPATHLDVFWRGAVRWRGAGHGSARPPAQAPLPTHVSSHHVAADSTFQAAAHHFRPTDEHMGPPPSLPQELVVVEMAMQVVGAVRMVRDMKCRKASWFLLGRHGSGAGAAEVAPIRGVATCMADVQGKLVEAGQGWEAAQGKGWRLYVMDPGDEMCDFLGMDVEERRAAQGCLLCVLLPCWWGWLFVGGREQAVPDCPLQAVGPPLLHDLPQEIRCSHFLRREAVAESDAKLQSNSIKLSTHRSTLQGLGPQEECLQRICLDLQARGRLLKFPLLRPHQGEEVELLMGPAAAPPGAPASRSPKLMVGSALGRKVIAPLAAPRCGRAAQCRTAHGPPCCGKAAQYRAAHSAPHCAVLCCAVLCCTALWPSSATSWKVNGSCSTCGPSGPAFETR